MSSVPPIETMDGLAFTTTRDGVIQDIGATNWNAFANANGAPELEASNVIGQSLFDFIKGGQVRDQFRQILDKISQDPNWSWVLPYRCDSPERMRIMCQSLRPTFSGNVCTGFVFQSVEQYSQQRPPIPLFNFKVLDQIAKEDGSLPVVLMCSWCQRVKVDEITGDKWITAEDYYAAGGRSNVRLTHGICEPCLETTADPFLN